MIRAMNFSDIPCVVRLLKRAHRRSIYADATKVVENPLKQELMAAIRHHGHKSERGTLMMVSTSTSQGITGMLWGIQGEIYPGMTGRLVADRLLVMDTAADPHDARRLLKALMIWADQCPQVLEVCVGINDSIEANWESKGPLYERLGLTRCGALFRKTLTSQDNECEAAA